MTIYYIYVIKFEITYIWEFPPKCPALAKVKNIIKFKNCCTFNLGTEEKLPGTQPTE